MERLGSGGLSDHCSHTLVCTELSPWEMTIRISAVDREEASRAPQTAQLFWIYCPLEQHGEPQSVWVGMGLAYYMGLWVSNTREKESLLIPLAYRSEKPADLACTPVPPYSTIIQIIEAQRNTLTDLDTNMGQTGQNCAFTLWTSLFHHYFPWPVDCPAPPFQVTPLCIALPQHSTFHCCGLWNVRISAISHHKQ